MSYIPLHVHSYYSVLDGADAPEAYFKRASELDMTHLSLTDHGSMAGHREFQIQAQKYGIKPILGLEAYISSTDRFDRRSKTKRSDGTSIYNHITLLSQNQTGLENLNKMSELAWTEGFYMKPRIDLELLQQYSEGIIVLSGCLNGLIAKALEANDLDAARNTALLLKDVYKDRFFIEVQSHNPPEVNAALLSLADDLKIAPVMASDCHYANPEDLWIEEALLILSTNPKQNKEADLTTAAKMDMLERFNYLYPDRQMTFQELQLYMRPYDEERAKFEAQGIFRDDIYTNTLEIASSVEEYKMYESLDLLPSPKVEPNGRLRSLCNGGLKRRGVDSDEYRSRMDMELSVIEQKDLASYFLILADMYAWSKRQGILFGPGRGSAAGSLVLYLLGLTEVDPIKYNLLFARFLDPERSDAADVDLDIEDSRRGEVKDYLTRKFKNVASISTFTYMKDKGVIRDAARVLCVPLGDVNKVLKKIETFEDFASGQESKWFRDKYPDVVKLAGNLRGRMRSVGMHAAGLIISKEPINKYVPIETRTDPSSVASHRIPVVAYDMETAAEIGFIKYDLLGLKTLTVIGDCLREIKKRHGVDVDLTQIDLNDSKVLAKLSKGYTQGCFQVEAAPYTALLQKMGVETFDHLVASNALVRPGAMNTIGPDYIARKQGRSGVLKIHPIYDEITKDTYGAVLYQEQVMLLCNKLAGMSWSDANRVRKIIGKKKDPHEFDKFKEQFITGASQHVTKEFAEKLWHDFEAHAGYSFNLSHSVAYSMLSMWTAWLKHYYPLEFMYSALRNEKDKDKRTEYLIEAKRLGIKIMLPHVNKSDTGFSIDGNAIRFGLSDVKFISDKTAFNIMKLRPFISYADFYNRASEKGTGINSRAISSLENVGALVFKDRPSSGNEKEYLYEFLGVPAFNMSGITDHMRKQISQLMDFEDTGSFVFMAMVKSIKRGSGWSRIDLIDSSGSAGVFHTEGTQIEEGKMYLFLVSDNRIMRYVSTEELSDDAINSSDAFVRYLNADQLKIDYEHKVVIAFNSRKTKAGKYMATVLLSDKDKNLTSALIFPQNYGRLLGRLKPGNIVRTNLRRTQDGTLYVKEVIND